MAPAHDLRTERVLLEEEIARLRSRLAVAEARVARAQAGRGDSRGFGIGLLVGCLLVAGTVGAVFLSVASMLGHMD